MIKWSHRYIFYKVSLSVIIVLCLLAGCTPQNDTKQKKASKSLQYTDDLGNIVILSGKPARVMALAPSMTEMLFFVCDTSQIVAVTQNCNFPEEVKNKPIVSNYPMDFEALIQVKPDIVFTIEGMTPSTDAERIKQLGIPIYYQAYKTVDDILEGLLDIGTIMGRTQETRQKVDSLRRLKILIQRQTQSLPKPKVLSITWPDPIYVYGKNTVLSDKLQIAGAVNAVDTIFNAPYPVLSREYILKINPDVILGGSFNKMDSTFFKLYPELKKIKAYQNRRVYQVTDDLNSRPSPRVVESLIELKNLIHPSSSNL